MDLRIVSLDATGEFTATKHYFPTFKNARMLHQDGSNSEQDVMLNEAMLTKLRTHPDQSRVTVEVEAPENSTALYVRQVFLAGEQVVPTDIGPRDSNGNVSYLRAVDGEIEIGRTGCGSYTLRNRSGMIELDGHDAENHTYFDDDMLDQMIDGLIMLRHARNGTTPAAVAPVSKPVDATASTSHLIDVVAHVAEREPQLVYEALIANRVNGACRNAAHLAADACHFDADGKRLTPDLGWVLGEGDGSVVVFVYSDNTVTARITGSETTLVHCPGVMVGSPYFVSDPTFDPLRITGRFDEIDDYDTLGLYEALIRERIINEGMPIPAFDRWLEMHDAKSMQSTFYAQDLAA